MLKWAQEQVQSDRDTLKNVVTKNNDLTSEIMRSEHIALGVICLMSDDIIHVYVSS